MLDRRGVQEIQKAWTIVLGIGVQAGGEVGCHPTRVASAGGGWSAQATHSPTRRRSTPQAVAGLTRHSTRPVSARRLATARSVGGRRGSFGGRRQILMPLWQVRLNGKNFWLRMNGSPGRFGFYTTRYVEATDAREAELVAVQLIRDDPELRGVINERADPPMIHAEEIIPVPVPDAKVPNAGYTFYPEETDT